MDSTTTEVTMKDLHPFGGRLTVIETPRGEETRSSGIVVPIMGVEGADRFRYGAVVEVGEGCGALEAGHVVYFHRGVRVGDVTVVDADDVFAYES